MATSTVGTTAMTENKCDEAHMKPAAAKSTLLGSADRDLARVQHHQRDRREQDGDQQPGDQRRREQGSGFSAAPQDPDTENEHGEQEQRNYPSQPIVELAARPLPLKPAFLLG